MLRWRSHWASSPSALLPPSGAMRSRRVLPYRGGWKTRPSRIAVTWACSSTPRIWPSNIPRPAPMCRPGRFRRGRGSSPRHLGRAEPAVRVALTCWSVGCGYLGMLAPVCGLCYFGLQAVSDRFTYLPQIGLSIALVWGAADALAWLPFRRTACGVAAARLAALMGLAWQQTSFWHDSRSLWTRLLACTSPNAEAHRGLGEAFLDRGQIDQAIEQCRAAIAIDPANATAHFNLGVGWPPPAGSTRRSGNIGRPLSVCPITPRPTTTWARPCCSAVGSRRGWRIVRRRCESIPSSPSALQCRQRLLFPWPRRCGDNRVPQGPGPQTGLHRSAAQARPGPGRQVEFDPEKTPRYNSPRQQTSGFARIWMMAMGVQDELSNFHDFLPKNSRAAGLGFRRKKRWTCGGATIQPPTTIPIISRR